MLNKKAPKAVHKRPRTKKMMEHAAKDKEATEMRDSQECILNGGVYLRHRLKDNCLPFLFDTLYHKNKWRAKSACRRAGVQETVPRFD
jgi:hypothetical protein